MNGPRTGCGRSSPGVEARLADSDETLTSFGLGLLRAKLRADRRGTARCRSARLEPVT